MVRITEVPEMAISVSKSCKTSQPTTAKDEGLKQVDRFESSLICANIDSPSLLIST